VLNIVSVVERAGSIIKVSSQNWRVENDDEFGVFVEDVRLFV